MSKVLQITYLGDAKSVLAAQAQIAGSQTGMQTTLQKTSGIFKSFGITAPIAIAAVGFAVIKFGIDSVKAYQDHERALLLLQNAIKNSPALIGSTTKAFEGQATALQNLTGYQDEEVLKADAVLAKFGLTEDQLKTLNPLVLDYARVTGGDAVTSAGNLGKALLGNTRALKTIGIEYKATGDRTIDVANLTDALRGKVEGVAEAYGQTLPGQMAIFKAKIDDTQEALGKELIPVMTDLMGLLESLLPAIGFVADKIGLIAQAADAAVNPLKAFHNAGDDWNAMMQLALDNLGKWGPGVDEMIMANVSANDYIAHVFGPTVKEYADNLASATNASDTWIGSVNIAAGQALPAATAATSEYAGALRDTLDAELALVDTTFSIIDALKQDQDAVKALADAQTELNRLTAEGKTTGHQYAEAQRTVNDAVLASVEAHAHLLAAVKELTDKINAGDTSRKQAITDLKDMAASAGLTAGQTKLLVGQLKTGIDALHDWNSTPFESKSATLSLFGAVTGIPKFAAGGIVTKPTLALIGEAGPEAIVPLGRGGRHGAAGNNIVVNVYGSVMTENRLVDAIHEGLQRKLRRSGNLGL